VDGVAGTDTVLVVGSTTFNSTVAFNNIDALSIAAGQDATISTAQLATLPAVSGGAGSTLTVNVTSGDTYTLPSSQGYSGVAVRVVGGVGNESITGWTGAESIQGLGGNDTLVGDDGNDTLSGGVGNDSVIGGFGNDVFVFGGNGDITSGETVDGTFGTDTLLVTANTNLQGMALLNIDGVSIASGRIASFDGTQVTGQAWTVTGVAGGENEEMNVFGRSGTTVDLSNFTAVTNASIYLFGGVGNDTLVGSLGSDSLSSDQGTDSLVGGAGDDWIFGGRGSDTLSGGAGSDRFDFGGGEAASSTTLGSLEVITDFVAVDDAIALGVTGGGFLTGTALDYATALTNATAVITGGTADIIAIEAGANTFVFADTNGDNVLDTVIQLTGTGLGLSSGDFVA
jgi:Ca2+-binding RTX toxin-like protein